jgi:poly(3-hydroxybutyrate) depolymerase
MKSFRKYSVTALAIVFILMCTESAYAGTRYKDLVFPSVTITKAIPFGSNLAVDGSTAALSLDFYEPVSDTLKLRPLVICIHGGSLIVGDKSEMVTFCTDLAKRGYVAASIDYRLGIESPKGVTTILEALLRGVQDTKAAVRFFRSKAAQYGIDTAQIFLEGSSAGSMIAVHYAYWNQNEIPGAVNQAKWGNIEGSSGNPGFSSAIKGIVNYCGAILDPSWIDAGELPVGNFHGLLDTIVPADSGVSGDFTIKMYGGVAISRAATQLGIYNQGAFFPLMGHGGNEDSLRVFSSNFLYSLMVLSSSAPKDFSSLALSATSLRVFRFDAYPFLTTALDKSGNKIIMPHTMIQYSCDAKIGTIAPTGIFTPSDRADSGYVYAKFNNVTASCLIKTYDFKYFVLRPKLSVTDTSKTLKLSVDTFDADSVKHDVPMSKFRFTVTDPTVGTIDSTGTFTARKNGSTKVIATIGSYSDTSIVRVESARGLASLDQLETLSGWTFDGANLDSLKVTLASDQKSAGTVSFRIDYKITYDPSITSFMVYLNKDLPIFGIPDSIYLDVKSDGRRHRLYYRFLDAESRAYRASGAKFLNNTQIFDLINAPISGMTPLSGSTTAMPPLTLKRLEIQLAPDNIQGQPTSGTIYVDNLRLKYPGTTTGVEQTAAVPARFRLEQNYPNPFNPTTTIAYDLPGASRVSLIIYNMLGQEVKTLVSGFEPAGRKSVTFDAHEMASGVYIYRLIATDQSVSSRLFTDVRKMLLIK